MGFTLGAQGLAKGMFILKCLQATGLNCGHRQNMNGCRVQGDPKRQHIVIFLWRNQFFSSKMHKPNDFWTAYIGRFRYFDVQYVSGAKYLGVSGLSVPAVWSRNTLLSQPWNTRIFCTWYILDIKIPKPPNRSFPKIIGFVHFWRKKLVPIYNITICCLFGLPCRYTELFFCISGNVRSFWSHTGTWMTARWFGF